MSDDHVASNKLMSTFCDLSDAVIALVSHQELPSRMHAHALGLVKPGRALSSIVIPWSVWVTYSCPHMPHTCSKRSKFT